MDVPQSWKEIETPKTQDTTNPVAEWQIGEVSLVFHTFPGMSIPPEAQVERWKRQKPADRITPQAFSGFSGLLYENETTLAWALSWKATAKESDESFSDVTFKATGPVEEIREELIDAIRSFERVEAPEIW